MPRHTNGLAARASYNAAARSPLSAIQELIGLIQYGEADVARFALGDYDVYFFAIKRRPKDNIDTGPHEVLRKSRKSPKAGARPSAADLTGPPRALFDRLIEVACRQTKVTPDELASSTKSKPLSLARALVAHYANVSDTASIPLAASLLGLHANSLHMSVRRYRKAIPQLFTMSLEQFLALRESLEEELMGVLGETWAEATPASFSSDAELGTRIARALATDH